MPSMICRVGQDAIRGDDWRRLAIRSCDGRSDERVGKMDLDWIGSDWIVGRLLGSLSYRSFCDPPFFLRHRYPLFSTFVCPGLFRFRKIDRLPINLQIFQLAHVDMRARWRSGLPASERQKRVFRVGRMELSSWRQLSECVLFTHTYVYS